MAADHKTNLIKYTIIAVCVVLVAIIGFSTPKFAFNVMAREGVKIENAFGTHTLNLLDSRTMKLYDGLLIESGAYTAVWHLVVPTKSEQKQSFSDKIMRGVLFWAQDRINLAFILLFLLLHRIELILLLIPSASFILVASVLTGFFVRKIKQGNFAFASPTVHRYAIGTLTIFLTTLPFLLLVPIALSPHIYTFTFIVVSILIQAIIANVAKRI